MERRFGGPAATRTALIVTLLVALLPLVAWASGGQGAELRWILVDPAPMPAPTPAVVPSASPRAAVAPTATVYPIDAPTPMPPIAVRPEGQAVTALRPNGAAAVPASIR